MTERLMSQSELKTFKRCRRKWWLSYIRGLRLRQEGLTGALRLGSLVHLALEAYYSVPSQDPLKLIYAKLQETLHPSKDAGLPPEQEKDVRKMHDLASAMIEGYLEWLAETGKDEGQHTVATEEVLKVHLEELGVWLVGRVDQQLRRDVDGAVLLREHKTVGSLTEPVRTLHMDEQVLTYLLLLSLAHPDDFIDGAQYNMLRKVKRTATANPPFYDRVEQRHTPATIGRFRTRLEGEIQVITTTEARLKHGGDPLAVAYPTPKRDCTWDCDFFPVCHMFDDGSHAEGFLEAYYDVREPYDRYEEMVLSNPTTYDEGTT